MHLLDRELGHGLLSYIRIVSTTTSHSMRPPPARGWLDLARGRPDSPTSMDSCCISSVYFFCSSSVSPRRRGRSVAGPGWRARAHHVGTLDLGIELLLPGAGRGCACVDHGGCLFGSVCGGMGFPGDRGAFSVTKIDCNQEGKKAEGVGMDEADVVEVAELGGLVCKGETDGFRLMFGWEWRAFRTWA